MKLGPFLFGLALFGVLSTDAAAARHHGHHFRHAEVGKFHTPSRTNSNQQGGVVNHSTVAKDSAVNSPNADTKPDGKANLHANKTPASGASENSESSILHDSRPLTGPAPGSKESATGPAIDTQITVHQGREKRKTVQERLLKKVKGNVPVGKVQNPYSGRSLREIRRNAIGAIIAHDKVPAHDATGSGPGTRPVAGPVKPLADAPSISRAPVPNSMPAVAAGVASPAGSNSATSQTDNRASNSAALAIVARSSQSINGTALNRPGLGTAAIGGSPKIAAGVISGNSVHLKHP